MQKYNTSLDTTPLSIFDRLFKPITHLNHPNFIKLHQGKTTFSPFITLEKWDLEAFPLMPYNHASPQGVPTLLKAIAETVSVQHQTAIAKNDIIVTCGATGFYRTLFFYHLLKQSCPHLMHVLTYMHYLQYIHTN